ncbi:MAG: asparagine synthase (glutamine-hydrolyzing) [Mycoplasmataceae bacterium]|nr:asparagine synthase (glutamine-hydrolyzing) [Mycoplasmataceae bacterium]
MCGITGFIDFNKKSNLDTLQKMTDVLHHRGPDDSGYSFFDETNLQIGLGHRRLSILDLSKHGHQPMLFENLEIVYNGEVYNFQEIREELEKENYSFDSDSDTEVILKAYHKWGIKAVDKFNGMFAISIYDKQNQKLILIRDRAGVKPFYWYWKDDLFMFGSELKSFHEHERFKKVINNDALALYLQYGYILQPHTIFENTYKIRSGHYLEIYLNTKKIKETVYWNVIDFYNKPKLGISEDEAIEKMEKLLKSAFEYRMVSNVPVGVFLSGGYDSSIVTALLQHERPEKINTFTIGFYEKGFDESPYAKQVAEHLGTNHTEYYCTQKDALEIIPKLADMYDEPFGDSSAIPTALVSQLARKDVTVSLSADGGDEIFAGYGKYEKAIVYHENLSKIPRSLRKMAAWFLDVIDLNYMPFAKKIGNFETKFEKIKNLLTAENPVAIMKYLSQPYTSNEVNKLLLCDTKKQKNNFDNFKFLNIRNDEVNQMLAIDYQTYMVDDILTKVDRATMSVGLEGREPLLDHRIIEFAAQLPSHLKYGNGDKKWILKQITHKYLPKEMMDRPKMGFAVPITEWFKDELKEYFLYYLNEDRLNKEELFDAKEVVKQREKYLNGEKENVQRLWFILMFEMWYERWM